MEEVLTEIQAHMSLLHYAGKQQETNAESSAELGCVVTSEEMLPRITFSEIHKNMGAERQREKYQQSS